MLICAYLVSILFIWVCVFLYVLTISKRRRRKSILIPLFILFSDTTNLSNLHSLTTSSNSLLCWLFNPHLLKFNSLSVLFNDLRYLNTSLFDILLPCKFTLTKLGINELLMLVVVVVVNIGSTWIFRFWRLRMDIHGLWVKRLFSSMQASAFNLFRPFIVLLPSFRLVMVCFLLDINALNRVVKDVSLKSLFEISRCIILRWFTIDFMRYLKLSSFIWLFARIRRLGRTFFEVCSSKYR